MIPLTLSLNSLLLLGAYLALTRYALCAGPERKARSGLRAWLGTRHHGRMLDPDTSLLLLDWPAYWLLFRCL